MDKPDTPFCHSSAPPGLFYLVCVVCNLIPYEVIQINIIIIIITRVPAAA